MTVNEVRENDLRRIIYDLHREYEKEAQFADGFFRRWIEEGEPVKRFVLDRTRWLYDKAKRNDRYLEFLLSQYKAGGYIESRAVSEALRSESFYYQAEQSRLRELKLLIPLVKPIAQLKK